MKSIKRLLIGLLCALPILATAASTFDIAHVREQNNDMIIVVVPTKFDSYPTSDKQQVSHAFKKCANSARISGNIVLVWRKPNGALGSYGPSKWHPFLRSINMRWVKARVNKELTCRF